jgi:predicted subunit of tRNA(5-methylaminomethyl-2-thiouridylate) methyltransferase
MMLGHAEASAMRSMYALSAYEKAVSLEPRLARDKRMRTNVELMLEQKSPRVTDAALEFLGTLAATGDGAAADQLIDLASSSKVPSRRHKAVAVADEVGLGDRIDRLGSYVLDLRQGESCQRRKAAVAKLRALGNKRAIAALRKARKRIRSEGGFKKKKVNTNACLSADAAEAIRHLQSV